MLPLRMMQVILSISKIVVLYGYSVKASHVVGEAAGASASSQTCHLDPLSSFSLILEL